MSSAPKSPPTTPAKLNSLPIRNGAPPVLDGPLEATEEEAADSRAGPLDASVSKTGEVQVPASQPDSAVASGESVTAGSGPGGQSQKCDPHEPLPLFDWHGFESRYEQQMQVAKRTESEILLDFNKLADYFGIWAQAASVHDNDRAFKRLKTREVYVQRAEGELEAKKEHYVQVVEAFKNALALLGGP